MHGHTCGICMGKDIERERYGVMDRLRRSEWRRTWITRWEESLDGSYSCTNGWPLVQCMYGSAAAHFPAAEAAPPVSGGLPPIIGLVGILFVTAKIAEPIVNIVKAPSAILHFRDMGRLVTHWRKNTHACR